jgi:hypothetical protein
MKRPPEPTSADLRAWRNLVRCARICAAEPAAPAGDLEKAEKAARRSLVLGVVARENPCIRLVRTAREFVAETQRGRRELADVMHALADDVDRSLQALERPEPHPGRRPRTDIDG